MGDLAGILVLLGLLVLSVPVLLVVALVRLGHARTRLDTLESEVASLRHALHALETGQGAVRGPARADATPAAAAVAPAPTQVQAGRDVQAESSAEAGQPGAVPSPMPREGLAPDPDGPVAPSGHVPAAPVQTAAPATDDAFDIPLATQDADPTPPPVPPPLPWERVIAVGATAAQEQDARVTGTAASGAVSAQTSGQTTGATSAAGAAAPPRAAAARSATSARRASTSNAPPDDPFGRAASWLRHWFTDGNVPVKIGMLVLFAGVAALLKYAADAGWVRVPMELRLSGVAAAAIAGLVFAWRQRDTRRTFALSLQGGAIGILMLVTFAAFKLYGFIGAGPAFGLTIALVAGLGVLAVRQHALALAVFGLLAGFLAPIWLSTGSGNHVALFSYYAVLNLAIFGIAWAMSREHAPWRLLNLLGFAFTFGIGTLWGVLDYAPAKFASTEPFLLLFFALYLLIPVLHARRRAFDDNEIANGYALVDGTLVFGTPLVCFALQAGLLEGARMPLAFTALGFAAVYALLAALLRRGDRLPALVDTFAVLAVGFATLAVPLALSARATASVFALEGAALVWLGVRQQRIFPQAAGLLLQGAAAVAYLLGIGGLGTGFEAVPGVVSATPVANPAFMGALLIALAGAASAWIWRAHLERVPLAFVTLWAVAWWWSAGAMEIADHVHAPYREDATFVFTLATGLLVAWIRRRRAEFPALGGVAAVALLFGVPMALAHLDDSIARLSEGWGISLAAFVLLGTGTLACLRGTSAGVRGTAHGAWFATLTIALTGLARALALRAALGDGWVMVASLLPLLVLVAGLVLRPARMAPPLSDDFDDYRRPLSMLAILTLAVFWAVSLFDAGGAAPLPWLPLLNPLELLQVAALALLAAWAFARDDAGATHAGRVPVFAIAAFVWMTMATLRSVHHWGGVPWSPSMIDDRIVQTALTLVWSVLGVLGWIFGSRRGDRALWGAGAVLMGVVLLKLLIVDRSHLGNLFGIVSFIAYGLLCTAVGYFAPAPPRRIGNSEGER